MHQIPFSLIVIDGLQIKSAWSLLFEEKVSLEYSYIHSSIAYGYFSSKKAEWSICKRDHIACKSEDI